MCRMMPMAMDDDGWVGERSRALPSDVLDSKEGGTRPPEGRLRRTEKSDFDATEVHGRHLLAIDLLPLRYLRDLLAVGLKRALDSSQPIDPLRAQRLAARIELPELDTIPVWACREGDGMVAIPFLALALDEVLSRAERVFDSCAPLTRDRGETARLAGREIFALRNELRYRDRESTPTGPLVHVPTEWVERVCGPHGALARLVAELQQMRAEALARCRAATDDSAVPALR